ncbi:Magnesium transport protein CorA [compost metagenome]
MIRYYAKHSLNEDFQLLKTPRQDNVWLFATDVNLAEVEEVSSRYQFDHNITRDVLDRDELPRIEYKNDTLYVFLRSATRNKRGEVITSPLLSVVQPTVFATMMPGSALNPETIMQTELMIRDDTTVLLLNTFARVVADYESLIHRTAHYIKDTGHRLRTHDVNNRDFIRFVTIEDNLNEYTMNLDGMLAVASRLQENKHELFTTNDVEAIEDIILYLKQLLVAVESHSQSITSIRNAYSTIANNTLNQRMKILTMLTVLIALPNVFYGMYGMNIDLPFQNEPWAYTAIIGFTALLLVTIAFVAFRKRFF